MNPTSNNFSECLVHFLHGPLRIGNPAQRSKIAFDTLLEIFSHFPSPWYGNPSSFSGRATKPEKRHSSSPCTDVYCACPFIWNCTQNSVTVRKRPETRTYKQNKHCKPKLLVWYHVNPDHNIFLREAHTCQQLLDELWMARNTFPSSQEEKVRQRNQRQY